jgi:hypothetical protein
MKNDIDYLMVAHDLFGPSGFSMGRGCDLSIYQK